MLIAFFVDDPVSARGDVAEQVIGGLAPPAAQRAAPIQQLPEELDLQTLTKIREAIWDGQSMDDLKLMLL